MSALTVPSGLAPVCLPSRPCPPPPDIATLEHITEKTKCVPSTVQKETSFICIIGLNADLTIPNWNMFLTYFIINFNEV